MKKTFFIDEDFHNSRLDKWFKKKICQIPQSLLEKNLRKGNIKVNNKRKKSSYKLQKKDSICIYNINFSPNVTKKVFKYKPTKIELKSSSNFFIENNDNFVVINKPAGISVQSGTKSKKNILDILRYTKEFDGQSPYTVHRLDKETSGILIVAKNRKYAQLFTSLFRIRKIHKVYLGIAIGELQNKKGTLIDNLFYYEGSKKIITKAITHYEVIDTNNKYSLVKLTPVTGRKHQLRKQLLMHGNPILGDLKYRLFDENKSKNSQLMLHAYKINFTISGVKYSFSAEPPNYFKNVIKEKYLKSFF